MDSTRLAARLLETVPANRTFGVHVRRADPTGAEVALETPAPFANAIGSLHASGLIALIDAAGLAAIIGVCRDERQLAGLTPLGTMASVQFLAPARGPLIAHCALEPFEHSALRDLLEGKVRKEELETCARVIDRDNAVVCQGRFTWKLRRGYAPAATRSNGAAPALRVVGT